MALKFVSVVASPPIYRVFVDNTEVMVGFGLENVTRVDDADAVGLLGGDMAVHSDYYYKQDYNRLRKAGDSFSVSLHAHPPSHTVPWGRTEHDSDDGEDAPALRKTVDSIAP